MVVAALVAGGQACSRGRERRSDAVLRIFYGASRMKCTGRLLE
jgi:hypothetical protein